MKISVAIIFLSIGVLLTVRCARSEKADGFLGIFGKPIIKIIQKTFQIDLNDEFLLIDCFSSFHSKILGTMYVSRETTCVL